MNTNGLNSCLERFEAMIQVIKNNGTPAISMVFTKNELEGLTEVLKNEIERKSHMNNISDYLYSIPSSKYKYEQNGDIRDGLEVPELWIKIPNHLFKDIDFINNESKIFFHMEYHDEYRSYNYKVTDYTSGNDINTNIDNHVIYKICDNFEAKIIEWETEKGEER